jgi:hypothetical protein
VLIKNPIDLGTIKEKLENDDYKNINEIINIISFYISIVFVLKNIKLKKYN